MRQAPPKPTVLLLGASGFLGGSIFRSITARGDINLRILTRRTTTFLTKGKASIYSGDITDPGTLELAMPGVDTIINAASYTGTDPVMARQVNRQGTRNLLQLGIRHGVSQFIQLSTTSVYGTGPHRGEGTYLPCAPESVASCSRASADRLVLESGGNVVRTGLVYGTGDKWFIPSLIRMATILGGPVGDGDSRLSVVNVEDVGRLITGLLNTGTHTSGVFHAAEPAPVSVGRILRHLEDRVTGARWSAGTDFARSIGLLRRSGFTEHQTALLSQDHWYQSDRLWDLTDVKPQPFGISAAAASWYRQSGKQSTPDVLPT